jgi:hypothetical protein
LLFVRVKNEAVAKAHHLSDMTAKRGKDGKVITSILAALLINRDKITQLTHIHS